MSQTSVLLDGLTFGEGPRWHDARLWFSDFYSHRVMTVDLAGKAETILEVPQRPSGLGLKAATSRRKSTPATTGRDAALQTTLF